MNATMLRELEQAQAMRRARAADEASTTTSQGESSGSGRDDDMPDGVRRQMKASKSRLVWIDCEMTGLFSEQFALLNYFDNFDVIF